MVIEQIPCEDSLKVILFHNKRLLVCGKTTIYSYALPVFPANNNQLSQELKKYPVTHGDTNVYDIIKHIPKSNQQVIMETLEQITSQHIVSLQETMSNQMNLFTSISFIHDEMFSFAALQALRQQDISYLQSGSLMALWGNLETILPKNPDSSSYISPEFVPLFILNVKRNPRVSNLLLPCLKPSSRLP